MWKFDISMKYLVLKFLGLYNRKVKLISNVLLLLLLHGVLDKIKGLVVLFLVGSVGKGKGGFGSSGVLHNDVTIGKLGKVSRATLLLLLLHCHHLSHLHLLLHHHLLVRHGLHLLRG